MTKYDRTIIYYSSNREPSDFEEKVMVDLVKKAGDIPIISVTQKPCNLGKNICVGDVGASGYNMCRQVQIACEVATTKFVISAEADCLYPPDYFTFTPKRDDICYRNKNIAVLKYKRGFYKKDSSTFSQIIGREFYLKRLGELFGIKPNHPTWDASLKSWPKAWGRNFMDEFEYFSTKYPAVSFKTGKGMRRHTNTQGKELMELPYWGTAESLRREYENK